MAWLLSNKNDETLDIVLSTQQKTELVVTDIAENFTNFMQTLEKQSSSYQAEIEKLSNSNQYLEREVSELKQDIEVLLNKNKENERTIFLLTESLNEAIKYVKATYKEVKTNPSNISATTTKGSVPKKEVPSSKKATASKFNESLKSRRPTLKRVKLNKGGVINTYPATIFVDGKYHGTFYSYKSANTELYKLGYTYHNDEVELSVKEGKGLRKPQKKAKVHVVPATASEMKKAEAKGYFTIVE